MEHTKEEIISELYALRAGLSLISENTDNVKRNENYSETCNRILDRSAKLVEEKENTYKEKLNTYQQKVSEKDKKIEAGIKYLGISFWWLYIALPIWVIFFGPNFIVAGVLLYKGGLTNIGILLISLFFIIPILVIFIQKFINKVNKKKNIQKFVKKIEDEINKYKVEADKAKDELLVEQKENQKKYQSEQKNISIINGNIEYYVEQAKIYDAALNKQFGILLSPADWQNVDLIIFYLQTGRADNMKEALQLADRQRQTDAIAYEIRNATLNICNELNNGLKNLGGALAQCFNRLSEQITIQHKETLLSQSKIVEALDKVEKQNSMLVNATELNNTLQKKSNVSSDTLVADLRYMQYKIGIRN